MLAICGLSYLFQWYISHDLTSGFESPLFLCTNIKGGIAENPVKSRQKKIIIVLCTKKLHARWMTSYGSPTYVDSSLSSYKSVTF
jgi:hypothetical protein